MSIKFIDTSSVQSPQEYLEHTAYFLISISSLANLNQQAIKSGFLNEDQEELARTIIWEVRRLGQYIHSLVEELESVHPVNIGQIIDKLKEGAHGKTKKSQKTTNNRKKTYNKKNVKPRENLQRDS